MGKLKIFKIKNNATVLDWEVFDYKEITHLSTVKKLICKIFNIHHCKGIEVTLSLKMCDEFFDLFMVNDMLFFKGVTFLITKKEKKNNILYVKNTSSKGNLINIFKYKSKDILIIGNSFNE